MSVKLKKISEDYLKSVYDTYYLNDSNLKNLNPVNLSELTKKYIAQFAALQDAKYMNQLTPINDLAINLKSVKPVFEPGNGHTDDLFEIYFMLKYKKPSYAVLIHDAWTLSRIVYYNQKGVLVPHEEAFNNSNPDRVRLDLSFTDIDGNKHTTSVQNRRLPQFVSYKGLTLTEAQKDDVPITVLKFLNNTYKKEDLLKIKTELTLAQDVTRIHESLSKKPITVIELKRLAKSKGLKGYSKLNKEQLLKLVH